MNFILYFSKYLLLTYIKVRIGIIILQIKLKEVTMEMNSSFIQTLNMLKSCESNLINFSLRVDDEKLRKQYETMTEDLKKVESMLQNISNGAMDSLPNEKSSDIQKQSVIVVDTDDVIPPSQLPEL
jgi:high-affinity K+ transport system ATPase subunit B